jgi:lincosamide nucleotidyltransferase A/C/D/E
MMSETDAVDLLKTIEDSGIGIWIDGGWGVDALIGRQTRPHNDIDIFIEKKDRPAFIELLTLSGYRKIDMEFSTENHSVWHDSSGHEIDLHLFEFFGATSLSYDNETYPASVLNGEGQIGGIPVRCMTAEAQMLFHQGYEQTEKDVHDVLLLCKTFGFSVPAEYEKEYPTYGG